MHQAGVIADDQFSHGQQIDGLGQRGGAAQVAAKPGRELGNFFGNGMVFGRPEQPDGVTLFSETLGQRCKVRGRPAFGRAEFGSWTKRDYAGRTVKFELGQGLLLVCCGRPDFWPENGIFERLTGGLDRKSVV